MTTRTTHLTNLSIRENLTLPKTSSNGILIDHDSPDFGWRDIIGNVQPKASGVGSPTRSIYAGHIGDYAFVANDVCDFVFHIPHDYAVGTDLHFHIHWSHNDDTSIIGNAVFTFYFTYAKGHNQENFVAEKTNSITYATTNLTTTPRYRHRIDEIAITGASASAALLDRDDIEVDGLIVLTLKLTTLPTFGGAGKLFIHTCDLHYQSTGVATKNKAPDFYT